MIDKLNIKYQKTNSNDNIIIFSRTEASEQYNNLSLIYSCGLRYIVPTATNTDKCEFKSLIEVKKLAEISYQMSVDSKDKEAVNKLFDITDNYLDSTYLKHILFECLYSFYTRHDGPTKFFNLLPCYDSTGSSSV